MPNPKLAIIAASAAFACALSASEKSALDGYVKCGMLTRQEAAEISKSAASVEPRRPETKKLKLSSRIQLQYEWTDSSMISGYSGASGGSGASSFLARRIFIEASADRGGGG